MTESIQAKMARLRGEQNTTPTPEAVKPTPVEPEVEEKQFHVFHCSITSIKMITDAGRVIAFVKGMYVTDNEDDIKYLQTEIAKGHPRLSVNKGKEVMTSSDLNPMEVLRKKHIAEYLEEQKTQAEAVAAGTLSESSSEEQKLVPGSTADTTNLASDSVSAP